MTDAMANALEGLLGAAGEVQTRSLDGSRKEIALRDLPRPSGLDDPRAFRHRIEGEQATFLDLSERAYHDDKERGGHMPDEGDAGRAGDDMEQGDNGETRIALDVGFSNIGAVEGVTSSTSVDWYGTEMSVEALELMRVQLRSSAGVPLLPAHADTMGVPEWDAVIGRSVSAEIRKAPVVESYNENEPGHILVATFALFGVPKAEELRTRLDARQPIGLSIGGWFTALNVIYNEDEEMVERIIVMGVQLDHVAATRMPANPDSYGLANLRSSMQRAMFGAPIADTLVESEGPAATDDGEKPDAPASTRAVAPDDLDKRHIHSVTEDDDTYTIVFGKSMEDEGQRAKTDEIEARGTEPSLNPDSVTEDTADTGSLDNTSPTGKDHPEVASEERSRPADSITTPETEIEMTPEQIAEIVERAASKATRSALSPIESRLDALEAREASAAVETAPTPAEPAAAAEPAAESAEVLALRAQVEALTSSVRNLAEAPMRRGRHGQPVIQPVGPGATSAIRSMADSALESRTAPALASIVTRHIDTLSEEEGPAKMTGTGSKQSLRSLLASGLRAAEADGLIGKALQSSRWA